jgi:hypothetical protein
MESKENNTPKQISTYNVMTKILNSLPGKLKLGEVINPERECGYVNDYCDTDDEDNNYNSDNEKLQNFYWSETKNNEINYFVTDTFDTSINLVKLKEQNIKLPKNKKSLLEYCEESKYGDLKTQTNIINHDIRKAYEITADKLELTDYCNDLLESIKLKISEKLFFGRNISFKLNKLNVYVKDCHFDNHVDTPRENMIGTLIIECPYDYKGGEFILNCYKKIDMTNSWIAFLPDVNHCIRKVTSGCRVTLTFYINSEDGYLIEKPIIFSDNIINIGNLILNKLEQFETIGLLLSHTYSYSEITNENYKDVDNLLIKYLENKCIFCKLLPVIIHHDETFYGDNEYCNMESIYRFTENDIEIAANNNNNYEPLEYTDIKFINLGSKYLSLYTKSQDYVEWSGNDTMPGHIDGKYFDMAFIISKLN